MWATRIDLNGASHDSPGLPSHWLSAAERQEWASFATHKRAEEFRVGRGLLRQALLASGVDVAGLEVSRDRHRAPRLEGAVNPPAFSICHGGGFALVLLGPPGQRIGIDAEPLDGDPGPAILDVMAQHEERRVLAAAGSRERLQAWVIKESVQKALGLGMHLDPRRIDSSVRPVRIGEVEVEVQILERWGLQIGIAVAAASQEDT